MGKSVYNIDNLKASLKKNGILRNSRFEVTFHPPTGAIPDIDVRELSIRCHECSTPDYRIETEKYTVGQGLPRNMPVAFSHGHHVEFSFYNDSQSNIYRALMLWFDFVRASKKPNDFTLRYYDQYATGKIIIKQLDDNDNVKMTFELHEAYPVEVDDVDYDSSEQDTAQTVEVKVVYRYAVFDAPGAPYSSLPDKPKPKIDSTAVKFGNVADPNKDQSVQALAKKIVPMPNVEALIAAAQVRFEKTRALYEALIAHQQWTQNEMAHQYGIMLINQGDKGLVSGIMQQVGNIFSSVKNTFGGYSASVVESTKAYQQVQNSFPGTVVPGYDSMRVDYNLAVTNQNMINDKYNDTMNLGDIIMNDYVV